MTTNDDLRLPGAGKSWFPHSRKGHGLPVRGQALHQAGSSKLRATTAKVGSMLTKALLHLTGFSLVSAADTKHPLEISSIYSSGATSIQGALSSPNKFLIFFPFSFEYLQFGHSVSHSGCIV